MKLPQVIYNKLDDATKAAVDNDSNPEERRDYIGKLNQADKGLKEKTRDTLWTVYEREGFHRFMQVVDNMRSFKDRAYNDLIQVKGEVAEVVLEIIINQFIKEKQCKDWYVFKSLILGNKKNERFSTELDLSLISPKVVTIVEIKSFNGEKILTGDCTITAKNAGKVITKDIFNQNCIHIQAFWDNFGKYASTMVGVIKSVMFSFSNGSLTDKRTTDKKAIMPVYTEKDIAEYLVALHSIKREAIWDVKNLIKAIQKEQKYGRSIEEHIKYVKSIHH